MVMHAVKERPAQGQTVDVAAQSTAPQVEHPSAAVLKFWSFMVTVLSEKAWNMISALLPFAALGSAVFLWVKFMPGLTENQLYGLGAFSVFALLICWIGKRSNV